MLRARPPSPGAARALAKPSTGPGIGKPVASSTTPTPATMTSSSSFFVPPVSLALPSRSVAAAAAPSSPDVLSAHPDAVERRQRLTAQRAALQAEKSTPWYELPSPPNFRAARTVADLEAAIAGTFCGGDGGAASSAADDDNSNVNTTNDATPPPPPTTSRLTVLEFFVPACPACRSLAPKLRQLAEDNPDVDFVAVNGEASAEMSAAVEALGVDRLPYFAFYRKGGERVSAFACNLRRVAVLRAELAAAKECVGECAAAE